jgi:hypothetical protein
MQMASGIDRLSVLRETLSSQLPIWPSCAKTICRSMSHAALTGSAPCPIPQLNPKPGR